MQSFNKKLEKYYKVWKNGLMHLEEKKIVVVSNSPVSRLNNIIEYDDFNRKTK